MTEQEMIDVLERISGLLREVKRSHPANAAYNIAQTALEKLKGATQEGN